MASTTSNIGLTKPAAGEGYSLDVWNGNMDKIDAKTGVVQTDTNKTVTFDASTMAKIGSWMISNYIAAKYMVTRCANNGASNPVFGTSNFGLIYSLSSANYGWAILQTDNGSLPGGILIGQLYGGTWFWYKPTLTQI